MPTATRRVRQPPPRAHPARLRARRSGCSARRCAVRSWSATPCASIACSSGTSMPMSPVDGLIVPKNATSRTNAICPACGNASPVAAISRRRPAAGCAGHAAAARKPTASVSTAEPSSAAVATIPIWNGLKPIAVR